ncbi:hypothetical protein M4D55_20015 [Metabacillus idriensis]|uniref:DUF7167 domain-containing protein n=1 Tax=Metabacillus idriensis TaxID=324768 RepID=A0A6I2MGB4_9BACI|nr:hypothetical protein [Metabacillus idriensis]MCM3598053.1 hypothetical protein [Metabacillus idriensis]MRX56197.1 hypothetical protein [Metabacillus idriensis]
MKVVVKMPNDFVISFDEEEFVGLSEREKDQLIQAALKEIVVEQVSWIELHEKVAI